MENNNEMHYDNTAEFMTFIVSIFLYKITLFVHFPILQIHDNSLATELLTDTIRLVFTVAAAGVGYLLVHWIKKNITHEIKGKK
jgi:hypothetical protein